MGKSFKNGKNNNGPKSEYRYVLGVYHERGRGGGGPFMGANIEA